MKQVWCALVALVLLPHTTQARLSFDNDKQGTCTQAYFRFGNEGNHPSFSFESTGLSGPEKLHRWTEGEKREATFTIPHIYGESRVTGVTFENVSVLRPLTVVVELNNIFRKLIIIEVV